MELITKWSWAISLLVSAIVAYIGYLAKDKIAFRKEVDQSFETRDAKLAAAQKQLEEKNTDLIIRVNQLEAEINAMPTRQAFMDLNDNVMRNNAEAKAIGVEVKGLVTMMNRFDKSLEMLFTDRLNTK